MRCNSSTVVSMIAARYPLDCGGTTEHLRFAGLFAQNGSYWRPAPLASRRIDVGSYVVAQPSSGAEDGVNQLTTKL